MLLLGEWGGGGSQSEDEKKCSQLQQRETGHREVMNDSVVASVRMAAAGSSAGGVTRVSLHESSM